MEIIILSTSLQLNLRERRRIVMKRQLVIALLALIVLAGLTLALRQMEYNTAIGLTYVVFAVLTILASKVTKKQLKIFIAVTAMIVLIASFVVLGLAAAFGTIFTGFIFLNVYKAFSW